MMTLTHPTRRKSGPTTPDMKLPEVWKGPSTEPMLVEITAGSDTAFKTTSVQIAKAFLTALGETEVQMVTKNTSVQTGADIALLILERVA